MLFPGQLPGCHLHTATGAVLTLQHRGLYGHRHRSHFHKWLWDGGASGCYSPLCPSAGSPTCSCWTPSSCVPAPRAGWCSTSQPPAATGWWNASTTWACGSTWRQTMVRTTAVLGPEPQKHPQCCHSSAVCSSHLRGGQRCRMRLHRVGALRALHAELRMLHSAGLQDLPASVPRSVPAGLSVEPGSVGLLGRRGPRSKQPFMVTFFRASASPVRATRAAKAPRRRQPKKSNDLPHPNRLPGIFGKSPVEQPGLCRERKALLPVPILLLQAGSAALPAPRQLRVPPVHRSTAPTPG